MKCVFKMLIVGVCFLSFSGLSGQTIKLGHINSLELLSFMKGVKEADSQLEAYAKTLDEQNSAMLAEYDAKVKEYKENEPGMMDAIKEVKLGGIQDLQDRILKFQQSAEDKLAAKREELIGPILEKAQKAIDEVAKENGYTYVFDTSAGSILFSNESNDIMPLVKTKLGLQ